MIEPEPVPGAAARALCVSVGVLGSPASLSPGSTTQCCANAQAGWGRAAAGCCLYLVPVVDKLSLVPLPLLDSKLGGHKSTPGSAGVSWVQDIHRCRGGGIRTQGLFYIFFAKNRALADDQPQNLTSRPSKAHV